MNDELYFVGCGYDRKMVRSYHFGQNQWTTRGKLRYDNGPQLTCLKSIVLNDSIFVVSGKSVLNSERIVDFYLTFFKNSFF